MAVVVVVTEWKIFRRSFLANTLLQRFPCLVNQHPRGAGQGEESQLLPVLPTNTWLACHPWLPLPFPPRLLVQSNRSSN